MNIKITGRELKATEAIKNYIDTKAERLQKYFDTEDIDKKRRRRSSSRNASICKWRIF